MTKEALEQFLSEGLSLQQIGRRVGLEKSTISYHLKKHGLKPIGTKYANKGGIPKDVLAQMVDDNVPLTRMARELGLSVSTVRHWLKKYELWPLSSGRRRAEAREARARGLTEVELECPRHGRTGFVLEGRGYHRCKKCRQERVSEWRRRVKRRLVAEAGGACVVCGYGECDAALHFHHLDPAQKLFALSREGVTRAFAEAQAEARKCVLLCSNCHAEIESGHRQLPPNLAGKIGREDQA